MQLWSQSWILLCIPGWSQTQRDPPVFAPQVLGLKVSVTTARQESFFFYLKKGVFYHFMCMSAYACLGEGTGPPGIGVTDGCELLCGCRELNLNPV